MKPFSTASLGYSMVCLAALTLSGIAHAATAEFKGRGVYHFASDSGCATAVSDPEKNCNRVALDVADGYASVDAEKHTILLASDASHDSKTVIGDVLLHGSGLSEQGQRVPLSLHVLLRRSKTKWNADTYVHAPVRGTFSKIELDPYQIAVREGSSERVLFTAAQAHDVLAQPSLAARVASYFIAVRPSDEKSPAADDITIALGVGKVSKSLLRASFASDQPGTADLKPLLSTGTWTLKLQALSSQIPTWAVQRQLFIFGLEDSPLLSDVRKRGFNKRDTLELGAVGGKGYLRYNGAEESFPAAATSGAAFMRDSFIGLILAWHRSPQLTP